MESAAYKRLQAAWVSSNSGSSMEEPGLALLPLLLLIFFAGAFYPKLRGFTFEFVLLIIPITLNFTALSYHLYVLPSVITACAVGYFISVKRFRSVSVGDILVSSPEKKPPWITNFRACTNLATIICILAVDLNIFPRKFAKTETFGFGAMDLGVGFYVVCNGLVHRAVGLKKQALDIAILIILGGIRLVGVRSVDYQEHVTEYGVHWNFFFTLAVCRLVSSILSYYLNVNLLWLAVATGAAHQANLSSGLQDWVMSSAARDNFLSANREGIASIFGYVTIYYASAAYYQSVSKKPMGSVLKQTLALTLTAWVATQCLVFLDTNGASRRLCNIGYIVWTLATAGSVSLVLMLVDVSLRWVGRPRVPALLSAINHHGLFFFLLGNILTGVINITIQTLLLSTLKSYCLLLGYVLIVTVTTYLLPKQGYV